LPLAAQQTSGMITGIVKDAQGAVIPGAKVTLIDQNQSATREQATGAEGLFAFTPLLPSTYTVVVEAAGFKKYEKKDIVVFANAAVGLTDINLEVGAVTETVLVQATAAQLQTESADRAGVVAGQQLTDLSIQARNFMTLQELVPGVVSAGAYGADVNGGRYDEMSFKIDGITNMDSGVNECCAVWINMDTIAEFTVITNSQTADIGRSGGAAVSAVTKSGTKSFHGDSYWFHRNEEFNANSWQNNQASPYVQRPPYRYNIMGFVFGGPIFIPKTFNQNRNKLFFFVSEEWQRTLNPVTSLRLATVPTAAERNGDFSLTHNSDGSAVTITDPLANGTPFPGNQVPKNRFNSDGSAILDVFPLPNVSGQPAYNYQSAFGSSSPRRLDSQRADYNLNDKWRLYGRYLHDNYTQNLDVYGLCSTVPGLGEEYVPRVAFSGVVNVTTIISPTATNEFIFGPSQNRYTWTVLNPVYTRSNLGLKYQSPYPNSIVDGIGPVVTFGGVGNAPTLGQGQSTQGQPPWGNSNTTFDFTDNLAKVFSKHVVKVGFMIERDRKDQQTKNATGTIAFDRDSLNPGDTNWAYSNALVGDFDNYSQASAQLWGRYRFTNAEWYAMDTWKVRPNLTIDLGIRFMILQPIYDANMEIGTFNPADFTTSQQVTLYKKTLGPNGAVAALNPITGALAPAVLVGAIVPGVGNINNGFVLAGQNGYPRGLTKERGPQYGPRIGLAWSVNPKTVVRFGGGVFYDRLEGNLTYNQLSSQPTTNTPTIYYGTLATLGSQGQNFFPQTPGAAMSGDGHIPTVYSYNVTIQRTLPFSTMLDVAYVGTTDRHLPLTVPVNEPAYGSAWLPQNQDPTVTPKYDGTTTLPINFYRPYIGIGAIAMQNFGGTSDYNGLQISANHRVGHGLQFGVNYTFSKALGAASSYSSLENPFNIRHTNYGRLSFDYTNLMVFHYIYQVPKLAKGSALDNPVTRFVANGWEVSGITTFQTGSPQNISYSISGVGSSTLNQEITGLASVGPRPLLSGNPGLSKGTRTIYEFFNTAVVHPAVKGSLGSDSGLGLFDGPGTNDWDISLFKNFAYTKGEGRYFQLRCEGYNAPNHTQFSGINTSATFNSAGVITNLPTVLGGGGGRYGFGAVNGARSARVIQLALKLYF
jgi:hypothetical protein